MTCYSPPILRREAEGGIKVGVMQISEVDREVPDIHPAAGCEAADIETGTSEYYLTPTQLPTVVSVQR